MIHACNPQLYIADQLASFKRPRIWFPSGENKALTIPYMHYPYLYIQLLMRSIYIQGIDKSMWGFWPQVEEPQYSTNTMAKYRDKSSSMIKPDDAGVVVLVWQMSRISSGHRAMLNSQKGVIFMAPVPDIYFEFCCTSFLDRNRGNDQLIDFNHSWFSDFSELMMDLVFEYRYDFLLGICL